MSMNGRPILTSQQLQAHVNNVGAISDVVWWPLFDSANYVTAGQTSLTFFAQPIGQGTTSAPGATGQKTIADTNMTAAGQLTSGQDFYMTGQELLFFPGINPGVVSETAANCGEFVNDTYVFSKGGILTFTVGSNRIYIQDGPLGQFPPITRLAATSAVSGGPTVTTTINEVSYAVLSGQPYSITPIYITATQGFQEVLQWPAAIALPSGAQARVFSRLDGYLIRNAQ